MDLGADPICTFEWGPPHVVKIPGDLPTVQNPDGMKGCDVASRAGWLMWAFDTTLDQDLRVAVVDVLRNPEYRSLSIGADFFVRVTGHGQREIGIAAFTALQFEPIAKPAVVSAVLWADTARAELMATAGQMGLEEACPYLLEVIEDPKRLQALPSRGRSHRWLAAVERARCRIPSRSLSRYVRPDVWSDDQSVWMLLLLANTGERDRAAEEDLKLLLTAIVHDDPRLPDDTGLEIENCLRALRRCGSRASVPLLRRIQRQCRSRSEGIWDPCRSGGIEALPELIQELRQRQPGEE